MALAPQIASEEIKKWKKLLLKAEQDGQHKDEARISNVIGNCYERIGKFRVALQYHERDERISKGLDHKKGLVVALFKIGFCHRKLENFDEAEKYQIKALALAMDLNDMASQQRACCELGNTFQDRHFRFRTVQDDRAKERLLHKARDYFQQSLTLAEQLPDAFDEKGEMLINAYNNLGMVFDALKNQDQALEFFRKGLELCKQTDEPDSEARALFNMGAIYADMKEYKKTLECYYSNLRINQQLENYHEQSDVMIQIVSVLVAIHDYPKALQQAIDLQALTQKHFPDDDARLESAQDWVNNVQTYIDAQERVQELNLQLQNSDMSPDDRMSLLLQLQQAHVACQSEASEIEVVFIELLTLMEKHPDLKLTYAANIFSEYGQFLQENGRSAEAVQYHQKEMELTRHNPEDYGFTLNNLANSMDSVGMDVDEVIVMYQAALAVFEELKDLALQKLVCDNLAVVFEQHGRTDEAKKYEEKADQLSERLLLQNSDSSSDDDEIEPEKVIIASSSSPPFDAFDYSSSPLSQSLHQEVSTPRVKPQLRLRASHHKASGNPRRIVLVKSSGSTRRKTARAGKQPLRSRNFLPLVFSNQTAATDSSPQRRYLSNSNTIKNIVIAEQRHVRLSRDIVDRFNTDTSSLMDGDFSKCDMASIKTVRLVIHKLSQASICLSETGLNDQGLQLICQSGLMKSLRDLNISKTHITSDGITMIRKALQSITQPNLESLNVSSNFLQTSLKDLFEILQCPHLHTLDASFCSLTFNQQPLPVLAGSSIRSLRLKGNSQLICERLLSLLKQAPSLLTLDVGGGDADAYFKELGILTNLTSLDVSFTRTTTASVRHLCHALLNLRRLVSLDLSFCNIDDLALQHLLGALPSFQHLTVFAIAGNPFENADALLTLLAGMPNLTSLNASHCLTTSNSLLHFLHNLPYAGKFNLNITANNDPALNAEIATLRRRDVVLTSHRVRLPGTLLLA